MNCYDVQEILTNYLANEVTQSQKKLIQAHLAGCRNCREELEKVSALQSRIRQSLRAQVMDLSPSTQAWNSIETRITRVAPLESAGIIQKVQHSIEDLIKKGTTMIKKPVFAALTILIVLITAAAFVPNVRAQMQEVIGDWFRFRSPDQTSSLAWETNWDFVPLNPTYMPDGLEQKATMVGGDDKTTSFGLCYKDPVQLPAILRDSSGAEIMTLLSEENTSDQKDKDRFAAIFQDVSGADNTLPIGKEMRVDGYDASLEENVSGEIKWCGYTQDPQSSTIPLVYENARRLTWFAGELRLEIISNLPEEDILRIAESMEPAEMGEGKLPGLP